MANYLDVAVEPSSSGRKSPATLSKEEVSAKYGQFFQEYALLAEYSLILKSPVEGVYVLPSPQSNLSYRISIDNRYMVSPVISLIVWYGLVFVRHGLYRDAVFKFTVSIPTTYPDGGCPRVDFQPGVFHPLIDFYTGELQTKSSFARWRRDVNHIHELLSYIKTIFLTIETKEGFNQEATDLYQINKEEFKQKVAECISECAQYALQSEPNDPHSFEISEWHKDIMRAARKEIFEPEFTEEVETSKSGLPSGLSWVKSYKSFEKEETS